MLKAAAGAALFLPAGMAFTAQAQPAAMDSMKASALEGGDFATMTSELALRKARSAAVRTFARLEINEQEATARAFGGRPGMTGLTPRHRQMVDELAALDGSAFDAMYVRGQIMGHEELLRIHRNYARRGSDPMARGAATVAVPSIETHLAMLRSMRSA
jgi:putative membrane protein